MNQSINQSWKRKKEKKEGDLGKNALPLHLVLD